jgi:NADH-quinone oxidoreductase subunit K
MLLVFAVAAAEIAIAVPILLLLVRAGHTLDPGAYGGLKG